MSLLDEQVRPCAWMGTGLLMIEILHEVIIINQNHRKSGSVVHMYILGDAGFLSSTE